MGNTCVGPTISRHGFLQTVSGVVWRSRSPDDTASVSNGVSNHEVHFPSPTNKEPNMPVPTQSEPPKQITMPKPEAEQIPMPQQELVEQVVIPKAEAEPVEQAKPKKPIHFKRAPSAGLRVESVLQRVTGNIKEFYSLGRKLGQGQFGTTFLCIEKATGKEFACKLIAKRKLLTDDDVEDVRREIQIMHHLAGHPNVIAIKGAYEDAIAVHLVMELCKGGELFDRIIQRGHYTERQAAELTRTIVGVVEACHSLGVMHRDLKPENFLFVGQEEDSPLKTIDFGLSIFFKPGEKFTDVVGSPYYVAPEILRKRYGPEADVWSAGVIVYILLSGVPPFWGETEQGIFEQVLHGDLDFLSDPWPSISEDAKDLVRGMLVRDPRKRLTAHEVLRFKLRASDPHLLYVGKSLLFRGFGVMLILMYVLQPVLMAMYPIVLLGALAKIICSYGIHVSPVGHPWVQVDGVAPDKPLDSAVVSRLKQFRAMNKLKKMALRVIADSLSEEEIAGLKEMFKMIDADNSGQITYEELKVGLEKAGANLKDSEIYDLMQAADVDNSGTIDYGEFLAATLHLNKIEKEDTLFVAFNYFDKDGSGYITADELQQACEEFGIQDARLEEMIREADQDNDGRIDYNEFVAMMQKGNPVTATGKIGQESNINFGLREALKI